MENVLSAIGRLEGGLQIMEQQLAQEIERRQAAEIALADALTKVPAADESQKEES
jgi:hypothetical protein